MQSEPSDLQLPVVTVVDKDTTDSHVQSHVKCVSTPPFLLIWLMLMVRNYLNVNHTSPTSLFCIQPCTHWFLTILYSPITIQFAAYFGIHVYIPFSLFSCFKPLYQSQLLCHKINIVILLSIKLIIKQSLLTLLLPSPLTNVNTRECVCSMYVGIRSSVPSSF